MDQLNLTREFALNNLKAVDLQRGFGLAGC